ncbi:snapalysin family zinc-dependent metalloprotease [Streptomyces sp. 3MP-14]|uniref:Extracellular small neutral protease n=1 Tax=Streptomyces mimosae TaxID=2586635 RepID=A0A5N6A0D6_9ACTN|nr:MULTISPECIES: snapalysin family zinc-dependent metalloprotease [Streptomyces]KAB8162201.1 snapalysin family zinc-dependent metalloprotease [Streptomyces mimosae]KAB8173900.1 snapalysin family zinc-dependent metalloprotease [Streptomyces sp. 3MP-14]
MTLNKATRVLVTLLASLALLWTSGQAVADDPSTAATTLTYDVSGAEEFVDAVHAGAAIWNESVVNVQLEPAGAGESANIEIVADDGWPRALMTSLGNGIVWFGRQAVDEGYDTTRIASHELGHILGLPDIKPGPCSSLMSGSTAGVGCTNPYPNAEEAGAVEDAFGGALDAPAAPVLYRD